jgi:hypothetical protein
MGQTTEMLNVAIAHGNNSRAGWQFLPIRLQPCRLLASAIRPSYLPICTRGHTKLWRCLCCSNKLAGRFSALGLNPCRDARSIVISLSLETLRMTLGSNSLESPSG